jgi:hypothetical protein
VVLLLVLGVQLWLVVGRGQFGSSPRPVWYVPVFLAAAIPYVARRFDRGLQRVRHPSERTRGRTAIAIGLAATAYLIFTGFNQQRDLIPKLHDEYMHLLQMQMLARGKLWMHAHPVADSFESFHIYVKPVYAGKYFPGTSLMMAPGVWLGLQFWAIPAIVCGAAVGLLYRVVAELLDGVAGILAALLLLSLTEFRYLSLAAMSHGFMVFWGLMTVWGWLRWRKNPRWWWALMIGVAAGWGAITRPIDAFCYAAPVGVAMLIDLLARSPRVRGDEGDKARQSRKSRHPVLSRSTERGGEAKAVTPSPPPSPAYRRGRQLLATLGMIVLGAAPFLALQGILNWGVTGSVLKTADWYHNDLFTPGMSFGFHRSSQTRRPATELPQRIKYYETYTVPAAEAHRPELVLRNWVTERFPRLVTYSLPSPMLLFVVPAALLGLVNGRQGRWWLVLGGMLPLFVATYMMFSYLLTHYAVVAAPGMIVIVLVGVRVVEESWPRWKQHFTTFATLWICMLSLHGMREFNRLVQDDPYDWETARFNAKLESLISGRAIVLWHWNDENNPHDEPVFNVQAPWPDDHRVVRAQDRGEAQNQKLFEYYAKVQPDRKVYWVDRMDGTARDYARDSLKYLGTVGELAAR